MSVLDSRFLIPDSLPVPHDPETLLMMRVAGGDEEAFAELVRATKRRVCGLVYRFTGSVREADDLAQEAYLRVWLARGRYRPDARFSTWLFTIVARLCLNERDKMRRREEGAPSPVAGSPAVAPPAPPDALEQREQAAAVRAAVLELAEAPRMAVTLRYFGGLSDLETAEAMGLSLPAVQALLFRARQKLLARLGQAAPSGA
jgi:RNA polymerase sigma-70 factor (ECF subfamily)